MNGEIIMINADNAIEKLKLGNAAYLSEKNSGDISLLKRQQMLSDGQHPYAIIISCSDSRVISESIFNAGIGDLFVIRVAGNVMDDHQLGKVRRKSETQIYQRISISTNRICANENTNAQKEKYLQIYC